VRARGKKNQQSKKVIMESTQNKPVIIKIPARVYPEILDQIQERFAAKVYLAGAEYVLDMQDVTNVYSTVISLIIGLVKLITSLQGSISIVNASSNVQLILRSMNIDTLMPVYDSMLSYDLQHESVGAV
jgi:anti-anti-sigma regulatory factor